MYVGIDAYKRFCKGIVMDDRGSKVEDVRFDTTVDGMSEFARRLDPGAKIVVEASSTGLYVYDYFDSKGFDVVMAHPLEVKAIAHARIKTDSIDAETLAHLLRADLIPEAYVPPIEIRDLRSCEASCGVG